ncbi:uncharacterized protein LOC143219512 [Lasioglossum baleicum]|uniref:uncharacterized protein LOC143219512 n=1 Tax=Lasioglossum baleicum TaxID=434251 RepID=UPI003FCD8B6D
MAQPPKKEEKTELRQILDLMQSQSEKTEMGMQELRKMILLANEENNKRAKEIEALGKSLASLRVAGESLCTSDFTSVMTEGQRITRSQPRRGAGTSKPTEPGIPKPSTDTEDEVFEDEYDTHPTHAAKLSVQFIPVLKGRDDIGVERFIKKVRKARRNCKERDELLDLILATRVTDDAERSIRHLEIETYEELFEALRQFVSIPTTADSARDRLRQVRQGATESVHSYIIRFRKLMNELTYALQYEHKNEVERTIAIDLENKRSIKIFMLNLRDDIETRVSASSPQTLMAAQETAFRAETIVNEMRRLRSSQGKTVFQPTRPPVRAESHQGPLPRPNSFQHAENRPLQERKEMKCFRCNQTGHLASQCANFRVPSQQVQPPRRVNHVNSITKEEDHLQTEFESIQQQEDYPVSALEEIPTEESSDYSSIQDQGSI